MKSAIFHNQSIISVYDLIEIAECALSPDELTHLPLHQVSSKDRQKAQKLLERWERLISTKSGDPENFNRRLTSLGLDRKSALERLQTRRCIQKKNLPDWAKQLDRILNEAPYPSCPSVQNMLTGVSAITDIPLFPEFLHPFINYYLNEFKSSCSHWESFLEQEVLKEFVHDLLKRLSFVCARTISADIKQQSVLRLLKGESSKDRYDYYVNQILGTPQGLLSLLRRYPVLGRLLTVITTQAIDNSLEFLKRLILDREPLAQSFNQGKEIGQVTNIELSLSDPHNGGQTVWSVTFESGLRLAYKSRSLSMDVAYLRLLKWFNQIRPELSLRAAPVLPREDYGWVLWIEPRVCENQEQVPQFYRRQGAHLAIFYLLGGTDFHEENFIADGAWPIPIDLESIGSAALTFTMSEMSDVPLCFKPTFFSIASTASLPRWIMSRNIETEAKVVGGIAGRESNIIFPIPRPIWNNLGTDQMNVTYQHIFCKPALPLPVIAGKPVELRPYLEQVLDGFTDTYRTFMAHRDYLLTEILATFRNLPTRVLVRNTEEYNYLLFWSTAPDQLTSGQAYDVGLEIICGNSIDDTLRKDSFAFGNAEKRALWRRDVPYFLGSTSKCYFESDDETSFEPVNQYSGYEIIQQRIKDASELDMDWQRQLIRAFFEMSWISAGSPIPLSRRKVKLSAGTIINSSLLSRIEEHLDSIGQTIAKLTVQHPEGLGWLTMERGSSGLMPYVFYPPPWNTSGAAGTAVFLANLAAYTKDTSWRNLAIEASKSSANMSLRYDNTPLLASSLHCQGLLGLASVFYALGVCAERLGDESCLNLAYDLVMRLSIQDWEQVKNPDILTGSASTLLTLIHLYKNKPSDELLERVKAIGRGILSYQEKGVINLGGFKVPLASQPLLGMAHGATGIAYALSSLYSLTKDTALLPAIRAALAYERSHYNQELQDWPNLQHKNNPQAFMTGWCAGAPGIGLALLGILARCSDNQFDDILMPEIEAACQATLRHLGTGLHHLCCGEAGRIIFLVTASQQLNRPELYQIACQATAEMLDFYEQKGFWKLQLMSARSIIPGLTDGIAGIGLALLTVIDPKNTSRFLTLE
ncbi:MAG: type 2 lantipeptide synthetase LanM [Microcystis aeruginosa LL13-06]|jgi:type 2 lantibiotic biosynthesis protein LanM|nr:type 2 lantipeptide synthetase LanM [Microcystis aeruginosa LL13-06]